MVSTNTILFFIFENLRTQDLHHVNSLHNSQVYLFK